MRALQARTAPSHLAGPVLFVAASFHPSRAVLRSGPRRAGQHWPRPFQHRREPQTMPRALLFDGAGNTSQFWWPIALSTLAGLSTSIGGLLAVVKKPDQQALAGLLGIAIGVMATISIVELIVKNATEHNPVYVLASAAGGGLAYYLLEPFFPKVEEEDFVKKDLVEEEEGVSTQGDNGALRKRVRKAVGATKASLTHSTSGQLGVSVDLEGQQKGQGRRESESSTSSATTSGQPTDPASTLTTTTTLQQPTTTLDRQSSTNAAHTTDTHAHQGASASSSNGHAPGPPAAAGAAGAESGGHGAHPVPVWMSTSSHTPHSASLMRLGVLMAITMTLHNMPEGFAVAFSAFTDFGPIMALAIALHNIPEGVIIAAPIYAATNSRWKAIGLATASGLSEPLGAVLALLILRPFITEESLQYMLACVGGLMLAVCVIELWPEARACRNDRSLALGITIGSLLMGWTLAVEG